MKASECTMGRKVKRRALTCCAGMNLSKVTKNRVVGEIVGVPYRDGASMVLVRWADNSESAVAISRLEKA